MKEKTKLLTEQEAANEIGMSVHWLRKRRIEGTPEGEIPAPKFVRPSGRSVRYPTDEVERFINELNRYDNTAQVGVAS